jgi:hypothetical protein
MHIYIYIYSQRVLNNSKGNVILVFVLLVRKNKWVKGRNVIVVDTKTLEYVKLARGLRRRSAAARMLRLWVRIRPRGIDVCCGCCVLSGRGLCDELITRQEESYRL